MTLADSGSLDRGDEAFARRCTGGGTGTDKRDRMNNAHIAAVFTWVDAAGLWLATIPVAVLLVRYGRLPVFAGLFESYGASGPRRSTQGRS